MADQPNRRPGPGLPTANGVGVMDGTEIGPAGNRAPLAAMLTGAAA